MFILRVPKKFSQLGVQMYEIYTSNLFVPKVGMIVPFFGISGFTNNFLVVVLSTFNRTLRLLRLNHEYMKDPKAGE